MNLLGVDNCIWGRFLVECFPSWFYTVFMIAFQMFLARAFFAIDGNIYKERRKYDRSGPQGSVMLTNRRLFDIFSLFFWFNNMFIGLFSLLFRMIWAILCGLPMLGRLDQAIVQRTFEIRDNGFSCYLGYHGLDEGNTHPVMIVAVQLFLLSSAGQRYQKRVKREAGGSWENTPVRLTLKPAEVVAIDSKTVKRVETKNRYRAKFRWMLAYTLINNPSLYNFRNKFLMEDSFFENKVFHDF